jgi:hypothetical protein
VVHGEVAIVVWWLILLGAAVGVLPRVGPWGWAALALLVGLAAWTLLGAGSSESTERSVLEGARIAGYAGVLVLALTLTGRGGFRAVLGGTATAMALVIWLSLLSRLHPQWFPDNDHVALLPAAARRLSYPLNYWNAVAAFVAMAVPLWLAWSGAARRVPVQAAAAAMVPPAALCAFFCVSRGGGIALVLGVPPTSC